MKNYQGILFFGQSVELAGRGISGPRLRTAAKKAGYDILIIDFVADISGDQILEIINAHKSKETKFVGFSTSWIDLSNVSEFTWINQLFFKKLKTTFPDLKIITGGHDEVNRQFVLNYSDYHFHGFSDNTFVEFIKMINNEPYKLSLSDNDKLFNGKFIDSNVSDPVRHPDDIETIFEKEDNFLSYQPVPIELSRGCIFRCGFCRHPFQGKKEYDSYQRTAESIARELARNYELFGTTRYTVMDDTFNDSIEKIDRLRRAIDIAKLPKFEFVAYIRPELLVTKPEMINMLGDLGLRGAFFGVESFNQKARQAIGKGIPIHKIIEVGHKMAEYNNNQMRIHASFIVGLPHESRNDMYRTQAFMLSKESPFKSWIWQTLGIRNDGVSVKEAQSTFDKNFEEYGYSIPLNSNQWTNEHFTFESATKFTNELNAEVFMHQKYAGWRIAGAWHINKTEEQIENEIYRYNPFKEELKKISSARVKDELKRLLNKND